MSLEQDSITFGKYKGKYLSDIVRDRKYCEWLIYQAWFQTNYEYLYNRVKDYKPLSYFYNNDKIENEDFLENYLYFNLLPLKDIKLDLTDTDKICYEFYLELISELKEKIYERMEDEKDNPFDIKAPVKWLQNFEQKTTLKRDVFKEFMYAYDLPNIPYIIERIKKEGGIEYKGAQSFNIAKSRSEDQEKWWENILKDKYGEDIGTQFKYEKCIFDFINISTNTIFECKLGLKDFNEDQHTKYKLALQKYRIIYLIDRDCVIYMEKKCLYTTNTDKYNIYIQSIPIMKDPSYLDILIQDFIIVEIQDISCLFGVSE